MRRSALSAIVVLAIMLTACAGTVPPVPGIATVVYAATLVAATTVPAPTAGVTATPTGTVTETPSPTSTPRPFPGMTEALVVEVVDGDTIHVTIDGTPYTVRYIGIDTPETVHPDLAVQWMGAEAAVANAAMVLGQIVYLETDVSATDQYGRLLCYVWLADGRMVNEELVRLGYAQSSSYPPDVGRQGTMIAAQQTAVSGGAGLWGTPPPEVAVLTPTTEAIATAATVMPGSSVVITEYGGTLVPEYMAITNQGATDVDMSGWQLVSVQHGEEYQTFTFPSGYILSAGATVKVHSGPGAAEAAVTDGLLWTDDRMWNNEGDPAQLYNAAGELVSELG